MGVRVFACVGAADTVKCAAIHTAARKEAEENL